MAIPHDQIDQDATKVVRRLRRYGFDAYLVGGCVRDLLLARKPKDFDVATSATPNEIKDLFRNCRIIGRRFRLAHIFFGSKIIETSTFRKSPREGESGVDEDFVADELLIRRDNVFGTAEEDARRRDFTINGLFYDLQSDQVIDYVAGLPDLEGKLVRTIGDPEIRFREDPVRILRAIKFAARLDFTIEPATYRALVAHKVEIPKCAPPRILEELYRLLRGGAARRSVELLRETGVLGVLVPELAKLVEHGAGGAPALPEEGGEPPSEPPPSPAEKLVRYLDAVDERVRDRDRPEPPSNAVLLGALLLPFMPELLGELPRGGDAVARVEQVARPVLERMRVSRRDAERTRQVLLAQRRLAPSRRRRGRPGALTSRDYFLDALELYEVAAAVDDASAQEAARWRRMLREGPGEAADAGTNGDASGKKRRRRRRGGRRRKAATVPTPEA